MSHDYEKDLEIIGATTNHSSLMEYWEKRADYQKHFNPSYTKQLVEKAMEHDALAKRVEELEWFIDECLFQITDQKQEYIDGVWFKMIANRVLK